MSKFSTDCVRGGYTLDPVTHDSVPAIHMTNAYVFDNTEAARSIFALETGGNIYTRLMNPTTDILEKRISLLEGGKAAMAASSGHGAMVMTFLNLCRAGDEIVSARNIYGGAVNMMRKTLGQIGITVRFVDADDPENFRRATNEKTRAYFIETIANPMADVCDLPAIAKIAREVGVPMIADNTVATPYLMQPIQHGADIVIHSATKFLSGNGTVMCGLVVDAGTFKWKDNPRFPDYNQPDDSYHGLIYADAAGDLAFITKLRTHIVRDVGACVSPFNAWVTLLGIETLGLRMARHSENGLRVAEYLEQHPKVERVYYPGLSSSKYYERAKTLLSKGASSVYCFDLMGGRENGIKFCDGLKMLNIVANLGDARSMVSCPAVTTHSQLSDEQLRDVGIAPGIIRISVGIEDIDDILTDLEQALSKI